MKYLFVVAVAIVLVGVTARPNEWEEFGQIGHAPVTLEYLGCFRDDHRRVLGAANQKSSRMDVDLCKNFCLSRVID